MQCRQCGTEIAEKAIVCFRCGKATTDPVRKAVPVAGGARGWPTALTGIVPLLLALVLYLERNEVGSPDAMTWTAAVLAVFGVALLGARLARRR